MKLKDVKHIDKIVTGKSELLKVLYSLKEELGETKTEALEELINNLEEIIIKDIENRLKEKIRIVNNINQIDNMEEQIYLQEKLINGKTNKEIATIMDCSVRNVQLIGSKAMKSLLNIDKKQK